MSSAAGPGHVFVVQGDLTQLVCDEVLIPTDGWLDVGRHWEPLKPLRDRTALPAGWARGEVRVTDRLPAVEGLPARRMVNSGATSQHDVAWLLTSVRAAMAAATGGLSGAVAQSGRSRPLLALPVLGTGAGGYDRRRGEVLDGLLEECQRAAADSGVDIAVVCHARADLTAVQARRRDQVRPLSERLGRLARSGELALFLGAGVSIGAGLPGWAQLLEQVAASDPRTKALPEGWSAMDLWKRASSLKARLGSDLATLVAARLGQRRFSLSHALLASLPGREAVTTNFDGLFESARRTPRLPALQVLPYERGGEAYLVKLHGDAVLGDVVLDREALEAFDRERRPLSGLLQGLLLTRHVLFVGCSMDDEHVLGNVDQVAQLVQRHVGHHGVGTILTLHPDPALERTWQPKGFAVHATAGAGATDAVAARELDVLLDEVLLAATYDEGAHLLDPTYAGLLDGGALATAEALRHAAGRLPAGKEWDGLRRALLDHGLPGGTAHENP